MTLPQMGVYQVRNVQTGQVYVGGSKNLKSRKSNHFTDLRKGNHHSEALQIDYDKLGAEVFAFELLEEVTDLRHLRDREQFWIDQLHAHRELGGYNGSPSSRSNTGIKHQGRGLERIQAARADPAWRAKISETNRQRPPEFLERMRAAQVRYEWRAWGPDNAEYSFTVLAEFCREHGLSDGAMWDVSLGTPQHMHHKGWRCERAGSPLPAGYGKDYQPFAVKWIATDPDGMKYPVYQLRPFCRDRGLTATNARRVAQGVMKHTQGWKFEYV